MQYPPLFENRHMGFYIKVFPDRVEFKNGQGVQSVPISLIADVQVGAPLVLSITITAIGGQPQMIPTTKKKEVQQAIFNAQAQAAQYQQPHMQPPPQAPAGTPIDVEIQRIKLEIQQKALQLKQVNANMSAIRAKYSQHHMHGGGKFGGFVRGAQRSGKDHQLAKQQPAKEKLQREKLALEQQLTQLKALKAQGTTHITH